MLSEEDLEYAVIDAIPLHRFLGMRVRHDGGPPPGVSVAERGEHGNHLGGASGAVIFAVAEAASATLVFSAYTSLLKRAFAVPAVATIRFLRPAVGEILARARSDVPAAALAQALGDKGAASLPVSVDVVDGAGTVVAALTVEWHFRPARPGAAPALPRRPGNPGSSGREG